MADAAELHDDTADTFDAEFEAAREAEEQDETGLDEGEGEEDGESTDEAPEDEPTAEAVSSATADAEKLSRRVKNLDKALKAERREKRELAATIAEIQTQLKAKPAAVANPEVEPDPTEDPIGWMNYARKRLQEFDNQSAEGARRQQTEQANARQFAALNARVNEAEADFRADHADYDAAAKHLQQSIKDELEEQGFSGQQLTTEFSNRMIGIATRALQAGKDPAEVSYNLAKKRGFAAPVPEKSAVIERLQAGQRAAKTLTAVGARSNTGELTASAVSNLKGAAFDAAFEKLRAQERRR